MTSTDTTAERRKEGRGFAVPLFALAYVLSTALSTNTSWRYFGTRLHVIDIPERASMFAVLEVMLLACTMGARANLHGPKGKPGAPGYLVWVFAIFAAFPAYSVGGDVTAGTVRLILGPVVSVIAFHLALGLELRHKRPGAQSKSMQAVIARELGTRIMARLGLAERDLSALEVSQRRAVVRAAILSGRISARSQRQRRNRRGRRLEAQLQRQLRLAGVAGDPERADALLDHLAVARHAVALSDLTLQSPWTERPAVITSADGTSDDAPRGTATPATPDETIMPPATPTPEPRHVAPVPVASVPAPRGTATPATPVVSAHVTPVAPRVAPTPVASAAPDDTVTFDKIDWDGDLAAVVAAEPPAWRGRGKAAAVRQLDELLPGRAARHVADLLAQVGVEIDAAGVRDARRRARDREQRASSNGQQSDGGTVTPIRRGA